MDLRQLVIKGELSTYLPNVDEETLTFASSEWIAMVGRGTSVDEASPGLRTDFLRRFGGGAAESVGRIH